MAEIEVLLDFGRPYVRLDDYNEMKERYWSQVTKTQDADGEAAKWQEHARAALARAEAAEARVAELEAQLASDAADENQWLDAYIESAAKDGATIKRLMARAAELEAEVAQLRPVAAAMEEIEAERLALAARVAELEAAPPRPRCAYCDQQATTGRTHYYLGFPTARELLCAQHAQNHPFESGGEPLATTEGGV